LTQANLSIEWFAPVTSFCSLNKHLLLIHWNHKAIVLSKHVAIVLSSINRYFHKKNFRDWTTNRNWGYDWKRFRNYRGSFHILNHKVPRFPENTGATMWLVFWNKLHWTKTVITIQTGINSLRTIRIFAGLSCQWFKKHTISCRFKTTSSPAEEYRALVSVVQTVASGHKHSPDGRQSIAVAWSSRKTGSADSYIRSVEANQGVSFPT